MGRLFADVDVAHIRLSAKKYLVDYSRRGRPPEPSNDVVQLTRCFRSYLNATSFFPFSNTFLSWKPFLSLLFASRISGNTDINRFFTRLWAASLLGLDSVDGADVLGAVPPTWRDAYRGEDITLAAFPTPGTIAMMELDNPNKPPVSSGAASNPYEQRAASLAAAVATISSEYDQFHRQCDAKLHVLRHYLLTCDDVWVEESIARQTDFTCTRIDLTVDVCRLLCKAPRAQSNDDMLRCLLCPYVVAISHILCLRLVLIAVGESVSAVAGDVMDTCDEVLKQCLEDIAACKDVLLRSQQPVDADLLYLWNQAVYHVSKFAANNEKDDAVECGVVIFIHTSGCDLRARLMALEESALPSQKKISQSLLRGEWDRMLDMLQDVTMRPKKSKLVHIFPSEELEFFRSALISPPIV
jgi:hypothetical protein